jgi:hypothetical protein
MLGRYENDFKDGQPCGDLSCIRHGRMGIGTGEYLARRRSGALISEEIVERINNHLN